MFLTKQPIILPQTKHHLPTTAYNIPKSLIINSILYICVIEYYIQGTDYHSNITTYYIYIPARYLSLTEYSIPQTIRHLYITAYYLYLSLIYSNILHTYITHLQQHIINLCYLFIADAHVLLVYNRILCTCDNVTYLSQHIIHQSHFSRAAYNMPELVCHISSSMLYS